MKNAKRIASVLLACATSVVLAMGSPGPSSGGTRVTGQGAENPVAPSGKTLGDLSAPLQMGLSAAMGQAQAGYHAEKVAGGYRLTTDQKLRADFKKEGAQVLGWRLSLTGLGRGGQVKATHPADPQGKGNRVEYRFPGGTEWYVNGPLGLEQGFTLDHAAAVGSRGDEPVTLALGLPPGTQINLSENRKDLKLAALADGQSLNYGHLAAWDAAGKPLEAWFEVGAAKSAEEGSALHIRVDDRGAQYPITVDPLIQQAVLTASDGLAYDNFGISVSLSGDGNTALLGARYKKVGSHSEQGAAYVLTRSGSTWAQQAVLTASDGAQYDDFGISVSLSGDGNTALIGAYYKTVGTKVAQGGAYVFTRSGSTWTQQVALTASDGEADARFGNAVSLSSDGNTAVVGAPNKKVGSNSLQGGAYVFTRSGGTWTPQAALTASDGAAYDTFGYSVSLSGDGNTALFGVPDKKVGSNGYQGGAYVFNLSGGTWTEQAALTAADGAAYDTFGYSVSLSGDGNTAVLGAPGKTVGTKTYQGGAYVLTRSGSTWSQAALMASDGAVNDAFGRSVSLSSDGNTALVAAPFKTVGSNSSQGGAYVLTRSGSTWTQQPALMAADGAASDYFGFSASLSSDGNTALIGTPNKKVGSNYNQGVAYVFGMGALTAQQTVASLTLVRNQAMTTVTPVTGSGGTSPLSYSISPTLPAGLTLNTGTGVLSGTPTVTSATTTYTVTVTDANSATASNTFSLTVNGAVTATQAVATLNLPQNQAMTPVAPVTGSGGTSPLSYSISPTLPTGLSFNIGTGVLSGTPTVTSAAATYTVTVMDANSATASKTFSLAVTGPLAITGVSPNGGATTGGTTVILTGTGFTNASGVSFGGTAATSYVVNSSTQITAVAPAHGAGTVDITVTTPGGVSPANAADQFVYAIKQTAPAPVAAGGGTASVQITGGSPRCSLDPTTGPMAAPANYNGTVPPLGAFKVKVTGCNLGDTVTVAATFSNLNGLSALKYGPTPSSGGSSVWYQPNGLSVSGNTISYTITDGGLGDSTFTADGTIDDPIVPLALAAGTTPGIPTLNEWGLLLLSGLLLMLAAGEGSRRRMK